MGEDGVELNGYPTFKENLVSDKEGVTQEVTSENDIESIDLGSEELDLGSEELDAVEQEEVVVEEVDELAVALQQTKEATDKLMRLAAEFENYKKRMERDRLASLKYAGENFLKILLPSIDNLERAIEQGKQSSNGEELLEGVELTVKGLLSSLEKFEIVPLDAVGEKFDPNFHEALAMENSDEVEENCVLLAFEKGYKYKDKLIRPAKVVVSKGPTE